MINQDTNVNVAFSEQRSGSDYQLFVEVLHQPLLGGDNNYSLTPQVANRDEPELLDKAAASASLEVLLIRSKMLDVSCLVKIIMLKEAETSAAAITATEGGHAHAIAVWSTKLAHMVHVYNELLVLH